MNRTIFPLWHPRCPCSRQAGVGLIEVLIAVLVLSVGFLGIAALQARSLSMNNSSMARSMATIGTYSMLDAMSADLASAKAQSSHGVSASTSGRSTVQPHQMRKDAGASRWLATS